MKTQSFTAHRDHLLVLDPDDEFVASLTDFAKKNRIEGGSFSAIGAFQRATIAYWNRETKVYENIEIEEQVEVLALSGSIARASDDVKIHAHAVLGRRYGSTVGGRNALSGSGRTAVVGVTALISSYSRRLPLRRHGWRCYPDCRTRMTASAAT